LTWVDGEKSSDIARGWWVKRLLYITYRGINVTEQARRDGDCRSELTRWRDRIKRKNQDLRSTGATDRA
jgi:hypothetical protein